MTPRTPARRTTTVAVVAAGALLLAGCQGTQTADKTGGDTVVLQLSSIDAINNNGHSFGPQTFIDSLALVSGGRITAQVEETEDRSADAESAIVRDVAAGKLDGGWPASRAFAAAGIPGLKAVEAPMTITSYAAEKDLVTGPVADSLLAQLDDTGIVGLGLFVGPLRRPFAAQDPLISPEDWQGAHFRVYNSPVQAEAVTALGGTPVNVGLTWVDEVAEGRLRGIEFDIIQYLSNGLTTEVGHVTSDVVLWPKVPRAQPEPATLRIADRTAAAMGSGGSKAGRAENRRHHLRREQHGAAALHPGSPVLPGRAGTEPRVAGQTPTGTGRAGGRSDQRATAQGHPGGRRQAPRTRASLRSYHLHTRCRQRSWPGSQRGIDDTRMGCTGWRSAGTR